MFDFWPKPPSEIACPNCGASVPIRKDNNSQAKSKPFCKQCGWNVGRARTDLFHQMWMLAVTALLISAYMWAITGEHWIMLIAVGWVLMGVGLPLISRFRDLPKLSPPPPPSPLTTYSNVKSVTLEVTKPRLNAIFEALVVVAFLWALFFFPRELERWHRTLPTTQRESMLVVATIAFFGYQLCVHAIALYRFIRAFWTEQHLVSRSMVAEGRVTDSKSNNIRYEFLDYSNQLHQGDGRDYTLALFEDMPVRVLYDPDDPSWSIPLVGLQYHRPREEYATTRDEATQQATHTRALN